MTPQIQLLLVSGSLRRASTNRAVLQTARTLVPEGVTTVLYAGLAQLPAFNPDDDGPAPPPAVVDLRSEIGNAGGLLFSVPEYAGGLPGSFKNFLDWAIGDRLAAIYEKPVAWINASVRDAADAHASLRTVLGYAGAKVVEEACTHVPVASSMIGADGLIADIDVRDAIASSLRTLVEAVDATR